MQRLMDEYEAENDEEMSNTDSRDNDAGSSHGVHSDGDEDNTLSSTSDAALSRLSETGQPSLPSVQQGTKRTASESGANDTDGDNEQPVRKKPNPARRGRGRDRASTRTAIPFQRPSLKLTKPRLTYLSPATIKKALYGRP